MSLVHREGTFRRRGRRQRVPEAAGLLTGTESDRPILLMDTCSREGRNGAATTAAAVTPAATTATATTTARTTGDADFPVDCTVKGFYEARNKRKTVLFALCIGLEDLPDPSTDETIAAAVSLRKLKLKLRDVVPKKGALGEEIRRRCFRQKRDPPQVRLLEQHQAP